VPNEWTDAFLASAEITDITSDEARADDVQPRSLRGRQSYRRSGFPVGPIRIIQRTKIMARAGKYPFD